MSRLEGKDKILANTSSIQIVMEIALHLPLNLLFACVASISL